MSGSPGPRRVTRSGTPNWSRSSRRQGKTRRKGGSSRRWGHASCGSGCAARVTMSPAARWNASCANTVGGCAVRVQAQDHHRRRQPRQVSGSGGPSLLRRRAKSLVGSRLYLCAYLDGIRLCSVRDRRLQSPDRRVAGLQVDDHQPGPRRHRARILHPRPHPRSRREAPLRSQTHPTKGGVIQRKQSPDSPGRVTESERSLPRDPQQMGHSSGARSTPPVINSATS